MADYPVKDGNGADIIPGSQSGQTVKSRTLASSAVAIPLTGTTAETILAVVKVPAGAMGKNGRVRTSSLWSMTNNANNKIFRTRFGSAANLAGVAMGAMTLSNFLTVLDADRNIVNRNNEKRQVSRAITSITGNTSGTALSVATVDTTKDAYIVFSAQLANAADTASLEDYRVEVEYAP